MSRHDRKKHRSNPCRAKGCDRRVPRPHVLCRRHWCALPGPIRKLIVRACREELPLGRAIPTGGVVHRRHRMVYPVAENCRCLFEHELRFAGVDLATGPSWWGAWGQLGEVAAVDVQLLQLSEKYQLRGW